MLGDVAEDARQRADPQCRVTRDGGVMLASLEGGETQMAPV